MVLLLQHVFIVQASVWSLEFSSWDLLSAETSIGEIKRLVTMDLLCILWNVLHFTKFLDVFLFL